MKRIEFIAPVEAMRGNLSETQKNIVYPTNDNRAYDGPVGARNVARNYQPIMIGAKRKDGLTYFSVKTKTTNHLTTLAKSSMAAMGAGCAIFAAMMKDLRLATAIKQIVLSYQSAGFNFSARKIFMITIVDALRRKLAVIDLSHKDISITINNPFVSGGTAQYDVTISNDVLVKFWSELANNPIFITIDGEYKGVAHRAEQWGQLVESNHNVLGLTKETVSGTNYIKFGDMFLSDGMDPIVATGSSELVQNNWVTIESV